MQKSRPSHDKTVLVYIRISYKETSLLLSDMQNQQSMRLGRYNGHYCKQYDLLYFNTCLYLPSLTLILRLHTSLIQ